MGEDFPDRNHLLAGELAKRSGVSTDTLRHYERKGVLPRPQRGPNGYRLYAQGSLERVQLVRRALAVGFTLDELARLLSERDNGGAPCREVFELAEGKLLDVEEQLVALADLRDELRIILSDWKTRLSATPAGTQSRLLERLVANGSNQTKPFRKAKLSPNLSKKKEIGHEK